MSLAKLDPSLKDSQPSSIASPLDDIDELVRVHRSSVLKYTWLSLRDQDLAETVTQDCFLKAYNSRALYRGECSVRSWLLTIAANLVRDKTRNRRLQFWRQVTASAVELNTIESRVASPQQSPETKLLLQETIGYIWEVVEVLPERQRMVFSLRFAGGMELLEIACVTGMKLSTVKSYLYRALCTVRLRIERATPQLKLDGAEHLQRICAN